MKHEQKNAEHILKSNYEEYILKSKIPFRCVIVVK